MRGKTTRPTELEFNWPSWDWQAEATAAFDSGKYKRFVFRVSRQIGKTALLQAIGLREVVRNPEVYWYVAPSYDRCETVYNEMVDALVDPVQAGLITTKATKAGWVIRITRELTGTRSGELHLKSLGNPEMLRGATIKGLLWDEFGLCEERHRDAILDPMLLVKDGWCVYAGTPPDPFTVLDPDFYGRVCEEAEESDDWWITHKTYHDHPLDHVRKMIARKQERMAVDTFAREYLAEITGKEQVKLPPARLFGNGQDVKHPPEDVEWAVTIDLADNEKDFGDKAASVVSGFDHTGRLWVLDGRYSKNPSQVLDHCYELKNAYNARWVGGQNSTFDKGFRFTVQQAEAAGRGYLNFITLSIGGNSKYRRIINAFEPLARAGKVYVQEDLRDFLNEWDRFPKGLLENTRRNADAHHFDMLDAAAGRVEHWWHQGQKGIVEKEPINCFNAAKKAVKARRRGYSAHRIRDRIFRMGSV
jgi:hypothetical protein